MCLTNHYKAEKIKNLNFTFSEDLYKRLTLNQMIELQKRIPAVCEHNYYHYHLFYKMFHAQFSHQRLKELTYKEKRNNLIKLYQHLESSPPILQTLRTSILLMIMLIGNKIGTRFSDKFKPFLFRHF